MDYQKILQKVNTLVWEYYNGEDRCIECLSYRFTGKHEKNCGLGELVNMVKEGIKQREVHPEFNI